MFLVKYQEKKNEEHMVKVIITDYSNFSTSDIIKPLYCLYHHVYMSQLFKMYCITNMFMKVKITKLKSRMFSLERLRTLNQVFRAP